MFCFFLTFAGRSRNQRSLFGKIDTYKDLHLVPGPPVQKWTDVRLDWLSSKFKTGIFALWADETGLGNSLTISRKKYKFCEKRFREHLIFHLASYPGECRPLL